MPDGPSPTDPPRLGFDEAVCMRLREAFNTVFLHHPEVKCLIATVVWNGNLNDAKIMHGVWAGPDGEVVTPAGVVGSMAQLLKMFDFVAGRAGDMAETARKTLTALSAELVRTHEELKAAKEDLARRAEEGPHDGRREGDP